MNEIRGEERIEQLVFRFMLMAGEFKVSVLLFTDKLSFFFSVTFLTFLS